jgi:hypothetical protein
VPFKLVGALVLAALLFSFGLRLWWLKDVTPLPQLLQGLGDFKDEANQQAYERRLRERFPPGTAEAALVAALQSDGFEVKSDKEASFDRRAGYDDVCRRGGSVRWTTDAKGLLATISGGYYAYCP